MKHITLTSGESKGPVYIRLDHYSGVADTGNAFLKGGAGSHITTVFFNGNSVKVLDS